jgi:pimeloyl-ACP methyl ester carboxylesterase
VPLERTESGLAYEVAGSGPPVLLIHSGLMDRLMWDPHWDWLAERFTAIRFDGHAFGESSDPVATLSPFRDAVAVLDAAGVDRAAVVGVSYGGQTAVDLALHAPERVSALVAVSARPSGWEDDAGFEELQNGLEEAYEAGGFDALNEAEMRIWVDGVGRSPGDVDPGVRDRVAGVNRELLERQEPIEVEIERLDPPAVSRLDRIAAPTLVITGSLDQPTVLAGSRTIADATGAEQVEIEGTAHLPNLESPAEFLEALVPFLDRHA